MHVVELKQYKFHQNWMSTPRWPSNVLVLAQQFHKKKNARRIGSCRCKFIPPQRFNNIRRCPLASFALTFVNRDKNT